MLNVIYMLTVNHDKPLIMAASAYSKRCNGNSMSKRSMCLLTKQCP